MKILKLKGWEGKRGLFKVSLLILAAALIVALVKVLGAVTWDRLKYSMTSDYQKRDEILLDMALEDEPDIEWFKIVATDSKEEFSNRIFALSLLVNTFNYNDKEFYFTLLYDGELKSLSISGLEHSRDLSKAEFVHLLTLTSNDNGLAKTSAINTFESIAHHYPKYLIDTFVSPNQSEDLKVAMFNYFKSPHSKKFPDKSLLLKRGQVYMKSKKLSGIEEILCRRLCRDLVKI